MGVPVKSRVKGVEKTVFISEKTVFTISMFFYSVFYYLCQMKTEILLTEKKIKQHNTITSGRYDYSACQLDVIFMLLAKLEETDPIEKEYHISVKDIELITGRKWNYQQLKEATEDMFRVFEIEEAEKMTQITLFSEVTYMIGTGSFYILMHPKARPYFFDLKNNYSLLELKSVLSCSSKHAKRLYGLACQWRAAGGHTYDIGELKEILGLKDPKGKEPEQYKQIGQFKDYVLDIAKRQINEFTDIEFDYELIKSRGRSFNKIKLFCGVKKIKLQLEIDFKKNLEEQKNNAEMMRKISNIEAVGIRRNLAELWAVKYWKQYVEEKNIILEAMQKGKIIEDKAAYLVGVFKKKGYV